MSRAKKRLLRLWYVLLLAACTHVMTILSRLSVGAVRPVLVVLIVGLLLFWVLPWRKKGVPMRLQLLRGGYEQARAALLVLALETVESIVILVRHLLGKPVPTLWLADIGVFLLVIGITSLSAYWRIMLTSKRLRIVWRILALLLWWVPIFNLFLTYKVMHLARNEYYFTLTHLENEKKHQENADCKTKYPLLLVHGVFFRDWQLMNYWGRIPRVLERCGATVYYGHQQSAAPVAESGAELAQTIREVVEKTGCGKVNIIAHSKGGLDSRYAISCLGCADLVASLTTINTPHRGCVWARELLDGKMPPRVLHFVTKKYNKIFHRLGDKNPDFLGGVKDLTDTACAALADTAKDVPGVQYQSVMSVMSRRGAAGFPLNFTYGLVKKYDHEPNDGLVARSSAPWGAFLGELPAPRRRGISHADMIDLLREDIDGFDVSEFYAEIVRGLKRQGL